jgi:hypothetical protein
MSFSQDLVLWLHLAFVAFTIGPVTLAIMSTPRYIRQRDIRIVRYLSRITFIFTLGSLGVLIAGAALASMISVAGKPWVIVSETLFLVAVAMLVLIIRDQRKAIKALGDAGAATAAGIAATAAVDVRPASGAEATSADTPSAAAPADASSDTGPGDSGAANADPSSTADPSATAGPSATAEARASHVATVEHGRIAMIGGLVALIWLVILVLMVWQP